METIKNRTINLVALEARFERKQDFAEAIGVTPGYVVQMRKGNRPITEKTARKIELQLGLPDGWLDKDHSGKRKVKTEAPLLHADTLFRVPEYTKGGNNNCQPCGNVVTGDWLLQRNLKISDLATIRYEHDNQGADLMAGDCLIVSLIQVKNYEAGSAYVFNAPDIGLIVYKVYPRMDGSLLLSSTDKDNYPDETIAQNQIKKLPVVGKLVRVVRDT